MRRLRLRLLPAVVTLALGAAAAPASAQLPFRPCTGTPDYECATLPVPLDPAAPAGETIGLEVRRLTETREGRGVLVALAGGPGQSATDVVDDFADVLAEGLVDRQLVVLDQRGTGRSGALRCAALDGGAELASLPTLVPRVGRCAEQLGPRRRFFTTTEVVADLEALRRALGTERLALFGVSYGAYVAQRYARAHPAQVDRLVLDSPVAQDQGGPFDLSSYAAVPRVLRALCGGGRCPGVRDPVADLRGLAARLRRAPLRGRVTDATGRRVAVRLRDEAELFDLLVSSDFSPALRGALPAAVRAASRGDATPLLRLVQLDRATADPLQVDERNAGDDGFSNALFFATTCQEKPRPPDRRAALAALGDRAFGPLGRDAADATQVGTAFCTAWPQSDLAAVPPPGPIDAPALVLSGAADLRTPSAEAARTAAAMSDAALVRVPGAGHAVVSGRLPCVEEALRRFFLDAAVGNPCAELPERGAGPAPAPVAPARLGVAAAVLGAVADAVRLAGVPGEVAGPVRAGGLRGGTACAEPGEQRSDGRRPLVLRLRAARYVPGVAVTGRATALGGRLLALDVRVRSGGRSGRVRLAGGRLTGRVGGRPVRAAVPRAAVPAVGVATVVESDAGRCR